MKVKNLQRGTVDTMELGGAIMSINHKQYGYYISSQQTFIAQCSYARSFGPVENSTIRMVLCRLAPLDTGLDCSSNYHPCSSNYHPCYRYAHRTETLEAAKEPEAQKRVLYTSVRKLDKYLIKYYKYGIQGNSGQYR
jgi:hypothetical protein